ncbi:MAG: SCO family protein [Candidatus Rokubacteria bacterium]|nr:SCO family protein [Candidatus Rokubacteria bacterium]
MIAVLGSGALMMAALAFLPRSGTALDAFADEFRLWCFGLDPASGRMQWAAVLTWTTSPLLMAALVGAVWAEPLRAQWRASRVRTLLPAVPGVLLVLGSLVGVGVSALGNPYAAGQPLPFPADALRTQLPAPVFALTSQEDRAVSLERLRGGVVVFTGVYAHCYHACPTIVQETRAVLAELTEHERQQVTVAAVTFDPENDSPAGLKQLADTHRVGAPAWQFLTGDPAPVNALLDQLGIDRKRDAKTGVIDHANLLILMDRQGRIAYRFNAMGKQRGWIVQALKLLVAERGPAS